MALEFPSVRRMLFLISIPTRLMTGINGTTGVYF